MEVDIPLPDGKILRVTFDDKGTIQSYEEMKDGKFTGRFIRFYEDGKRWEVGNYINGTVSHYSKNDGRLFGIEVFENKEIIYWVEIDRDGNFEIKFPNPKNGV